MERWLQSWQPRAIAFCDFFQSICLNYCACHEKVMPGRTNFCDFATSKSGPKLFCTFWLRNLLRATTACTFSTSQLPKVLRPWCVLYIVTWKCASRQNGVQFLISHLARCLRTRRFSEPTFRPSGATNHWKNEVFRDFFYLFAHLNLLSFDSFSSLICSLLLFSSLCLFPSLLFICPYCRKFDF